MVNARWLQLGASLVAMVKIANLQYSWTLFVEPIQAARGWRLSEVQFAFTLFILCQVWTQPLDGWLVDRLGPRGFVSAAGLLCGFGWAGMGYTTSLPVMYLLYCAAGVGAAFVYSCSIGLALRWFHDRRGLAAGILAAGFGGGTALFVPIIASIIETRGYQAAFIASGLVQGVVILVVAQVLRHPADARPAPPRPAGAVSADPRRQFSTLDMLRSPQSTDPRVMPDTGAPVEKHMTADRGIAADEHTVGHDRSFPERSARQDRAAHADVRPVPRPFRCLF
jgi:OFA family oxalate/formate antiporter-like MFS transporter